LMCEPMVVIFMHLMVNFLQILV